MLARRISRAGAVVALAAVPGALAGCAGAVRASGRGMIRVDVSEYRLRPDDLLARAGRITLSVSNLGRLTHNLQIFSGTREIAASPPIRPRGTAVLVVRLPAGTYTVSSGVLSDDALGERGTLRVLRR